MSNYNRNILNTAGVGILNLVVGITFSVGILTAIGVGLLGFCVYDLYKDGKDAI